MRHVYQVRSAETGDFPRILELYANARKFMASNGNPTQWGTTNPPASQLTADIADGNLYVIVDADTIRGVFAFLLGEDPTYRIIRDGAWHSDQPYGTIHRVAGDGSGGIFAACVAYCLTRCYYLRVDTHRDNLPMQRAIQAMGFRYCGVITIADGSERLAYDRI